MLTAFALLHRRQQVRLSVHPGPCIPLVAVVLLRFGLLATTPGLLFPELSKALAATADSGTIPARARFNNFVIDRPTFRTSHTNQLVS